MTDKARLRSARAVWLVWLPLLMVSLLHYLTPTHLHWVHDVARRLYYLPIVLAAFLAGPTGGLTAAAVAIASYLPHAVGGGGGHMDPASSSQKLLEAIMYVVVGGLTGVLVLQERRRRLAQEALAAKLNQALADMRAMEGQLIRAGRLEAVGQLTAGLAHEIRNPLHAIRGTAEILVDQVPEASEEAALGRGMLGEIDRLGALLGRFLAFATRGSGPEHAPVPLAEITHRVATLIHAQAAQASVTVGVSGPPNLRAQAHADDLVQIVLGIALNALQAIGDRGHGEIRLRTHVDRPNNRVGITVSNDGPPIPEALIERVFNPFVTGRADGTGLGLAVAWRLVEAQSGTIEASNDADGVRFTIWLAPADEALER